MLTLWDLLAPVRKIVRPTPARAVSQPNGRRVPRASPALERYERVEREMLARYGIRVRRWRTGTTGVAWQVTYTNGRVAGLIESPRPRGPVSAAVFLHEIGHHAIGFNRYKPRCLEEYHAWKFSLEQMEAWDLAITPRVRLRVRDSLRYAIDKARRRGLRVTPPEIIEFIDEQSSLVEQAARAVQGSALSRSSPKRASTKASGSKG